MNEIGEMSDEEERLREALERDEIVAKYELGREDGAEIDAWEDPTFEVYQTIDRYGFMHSEKVPESSAKSDAKLVEKESNRDKKWLAMTRNNQEWEKCVKNTKVTERTYKGIPEKMRGRVWCLMLDIEATIKSKEGVFENMKKLSKKWSPYVKQIDLDINRTFRDNIMFRKRYDIKQQALFNVLCAYSIYDEDVGYCQGMSEVAGLLLMYMNEEEAFWCLCSMMTTKKHNMRGFYLPGFPKLLRFKDHHDELIRKNFKKVKKHLDKCDIHTITFCMKWFLQCFLDRVPFHLALRLWDIYVWEGEGLLVAMAYTIIRIQRDQLLKLSDEEILKFFQTDLSKSFGCDDEFVIKTLKLSMNDLKQSNKLIPSQPSAPGNPEEIKKQLGSFQPPFLLQKISPKAKTDDDYIATLERMIQVILKQYCLKNDGSVFVMNIMENNLLDRVPFGKKFVRMSASKRITRVSIPADGGPELGVDALIEEGESGWRTLDRYVSQDFGGEIVDRSDNNSPSLPYRLSNADGLSSCTSLASRDERDDDFGDASIVADDENDKIRSGSPDTLNGGSLDGDFPPPPPLHLMERMSTTHVYDKLGREEITAHMSITSESEDEIQPSSDNRVIKLSKASKGLSSRGKDFQSGQPRELTSDKISSYKTSSSPSIASSHLDFRQTKTGTLLPSATSYDISDSQYDRRPYQKYSNDIRSDPDQYSSAYSSRFFQNKNQNLSPMAFPGKTINGNPNKDIPYYSSVSYLGRKVPHRAELLDRNPFSSTKKDVSVVIVGDDNDVVLKKGDAAYSSLNFVRNKDRYHQSPGLISEKDPRQRNFVPHPVITNPNKDYVLNYYKKIPTHSINTYSSYSGSQQTNPNINKSVKSNHNRFFSTSDLFQNHYVNRTNVQESAESSGLYHPDHKGVTRIWTGFSVSDDPSNSYDVNDPVSQQNERVTNASFPTSHSNQYIKKYTHF